MVTQPPTSAPGRTSRDGQKQKGAGHPTGALLYTLPCFLPLSRMYRRLVVRDGFRVLLAFAVRIEEHGKYEEQPQDDGDGHEEAEKTAAHLIAPPEARIGLRVSLPVPHRPA